MLAVHTPRARTFVGCFTVKLQQDQITQELNKRLFHSVDVPKYSMRLFICRSTNPTAMPFRLKCNLQLTVNKMKSSINPSSVGAPSKRRCVLLNAPQVPTLIHDRLRQRGDAVKERPPASTGGTCWQSHLQACNLAAQLCLTGCKRPGVVGCLLQLLLKLRLFGARPLHLLAKPSRLQSTKSVRSQWIQNYTRVLQQSIACGWNPTPPPFPLYARTHTPQSIYFESPAPRPSNPPPDPLTILLFSRPPSFRLIISNWLRHR